MGTSQNLVIFSLESSGGFVWKAVQISQKANNARLYSFTISILIYIFIIMASKRTKTSGLRENHLLSLLLWAYSKEVGRYELRQTSSYVYVMT